MNFATRCQQAAIVGALILLSVMPVLSADGQPLAVRTWQAGNLTIETHWGLCVAIGSVPANRMQPQPSVWLNADSKYDHVLTRLPNEDKAKFVTRAEMKSEDSNGLTVSSLQADSAHALDIRVDGVRLVYASAADLPGIAQTVAQTTSDKPVDLLVIAFMNDADDAGVAGSNKAVTAIAPRDMLLVTMRSDVHAHAATIQKALKSTFEIEKRNHNTLAVSSAKKKTSENRIVVLSNKPWSMPDDLEKLFSGMEKSCADSQAVFAKLSAKQLNFKPSNGTHTPRWNTEHMMGRQLLFFSQIYNRIDPTIPVMDLNPKQMPRDYVYAHPQWDGKEEARQTQRVSDFTRRFAYLLEGLNVNQRAPGSRWPSLRALLLQMQRHYGEHTKNTVKKYSLPGFPQK